MFDICYIIQTMKETYLTAEQIAKALRISKEKVSLLAKHGLFPKPLELHNGAVLWNSIVTGKLFLY